MTKAFLNPVVSDAVRLLQVVNAKDLIKEHDPIFMLCAKLACAQANKYIKWPLEKQELKEIYKKQGTPIPLRRSPIVSVAEVILDDTTLLEEDWYLEDGEVVIDNISESFDLIVDKDEWTIKVTYTAGFLNASEDEEILSALVHQTIVNYNRRDIIGLSSFATDKGVSKLPVDKGALSDTAKSILAAYVYYGKGYSV